MNILFVFVLLIAIIGLNWLGVRYLIDYLTQHNIVDRPNERTLHLGTVPRGAGLIIVLSLLLGLLGVTVLSGRIDVFGTLGLLIACWAGLSWWDDQFDLSPWRRFSVQVVLSIVTILAYGWIIDVQIASDTWITLSWFGMPLSVLGVLWLANLYNFMDGMDGMAAAQTIIAATTLSFWFWHASDVYLAFLCAVLAAACYGFLLWNWHPAKIFMGDVGSITIGAFFATLIVIGITRYQFSLVSCGLLFAVFVGDTTLTLLRRVSRKEKFWLPHRSHYYQRLAVSGVSHSKTVVAAIILMLLCSLIATVSLLYRDIILYALFAVIALLGLAIVIVTNIERNNRKL